MREILIIPQQPIPASDAELRETLCCNRRFEVRSCLDRDSAKAWLTRDAEVSTST